MNYNDNNPMSFSTRESASASYDMGLRSYMLNIYNYMASALFLTAIMAWLGANYEPLQQALFQVNGNHLGLTGFGYLVAFAPLGFVLVMSLGINKMSVSTLQAVFWGFSAVMGLSLSSLFFVYTGASIVRVFFITSIVFGTVSMIGYTTKRDLTGFGHFLMMGLIGVILASIVNIFMQSSGLQFAMSILSVLIFTGLTAYDTQKIKALYYQVGGTEAASKYAVMGALELYLDFINIFIQLLRFFGDRKN
ncbi:MAG: Bax inhibitor-1/YccA family protein, partial [Pseudomonadota bacterium]